MTKLELMGPQDWQNMQQLAQTFVLSGLFETSDAEARQGMTVEKKQAQAVVKILAGRVLGLDPYSAMRGLNIIKGKVVPGYQVLGAVVNSAPGYKYKVTQWDNDAAVIEFYRDGKLLGTSRFDTQDMQTAGLGGGPWQKFKRNMLFARAMSNGVNIYCPEVTNGAVHTPADFGFVEDDDGNLIEVEEDKTGGKEPPKPEKATKSAAKDKQKKEPSSEPVSAPNSEPDPKPAEPESSVQDAELDSLFIDNQPQDAEIVDTTEVDGDVPECLANFMQWVDAERVINDPPIEQVKVALTGIYESLLPGQTPDGKSRGKEELNKFMSGARVPDAPVSEWLTWAVATDCAMHAYNLSRS